MGGLFASLHTASGALAAFSKALGVESQNVSNAATPGYAAQRATIRPVEVGGASAGGDSVQITSTSNAQLDALVQAASAQAGFSGAQVSQLSPVNSTFDITGSSGILAAFQQFSSAFANVAADPNNQSLRSLALSAAGSVANEFQSAANALSAQQTQTNTAIQSTVSQINSLAADIQQINSGISVNGASGSSDATLRNTLDQLSSLIDIQVQTNQNGTVTVLAAGQIPLVSGTQTSALSVNMSNPPGQQVSSSAWGGTTANVGGQLGALLDFNNSTLASLTGSGSQQGSLNVLAQSFADSVNTLLTSGQTTAGNPGAPLFAYDSSNGGVNVAATLSVDPSVTADQLALASGTQSNGVANSLSQLASTTDPTQQINGLSPTDYYAAIASGIGQQLSTATNQSSADQGALTSAQATRQQQTGVSLDAEAINITADQRAYEASAQLVTVLDQLTQDTIQLLGSQGAA